jgi:hypothetical protein
MVGYAKIYFCIQKQTGKSSFDDGHRWEGSRNELKGIRFDVMILDHLV